MDFPYDLLSGLTSMRPETVYNEKELIRDLNNNMNHFC